MSLLHFSRGQNVAFGSAYIFVILNFWGEFMTDVAPVKNYCYQPFSFEGPFLNNTIIKKCSKESNKKCLEITEGSLLFHCQNRPNVKVNRCRFYYLK